MIVYLVRHAQTVANLTGVIQGQTDTEITREGWADAKRMAAFFPDKHILRIYSSPLKRAMKTARLIARACGFRPGSILRDDRLMEIDLRPWARRKIAELELSGDPGFQTYRNDPAAFAPQAGESLWDVQARVRDFFASLEEEEGNIAVVSHSMTIRTLLLYLEDKPMDRVWQYSIPSVSVSTVVLEDGRATVTGIGALS